MKRDQGSLTGILNTSAILPAPALLIFETVQEAKQPTFIKASFLHKATTKTGKEGLAKLLEKYVLRNLSYRNIYASAVHCSFVSNREKLETI